MSTTTTTTPPSFEVEAKASGGRNFPVCPPGMHAGVCVGLIDLGTHTETYSDSGNTFDVRKIALIFETTRARTPDGEPFYFAERYSLTFTEKAGLRKLVERWENRKIENGEKFDPVKLLGKPCMLSVTASRAKSGKDYAKLDAITSVPDGMTTAPQSRPSFVWVCDPVNSPPNEDWLPYLYGESIKSIIESSKEFGGATGGARKPESQAANGTAKSDSTPGTELLLWIKEQDQKRPTLELQRYMDGWAAVHEFPDQMGTWNADQVQEGFTEARRKLLAKFPDADESGGEDKIPF